MEATRFQDQWALVTGAGRGFGMHVARRLAREGANIIAHYNRSSEGAAMLAEEVRGLGRDCIVVQADVTSWDQVKRMAGDVSWTAGAFGCPCE